MDRSEEGLAELKSRLGCETIQVDLACPDDTLKAAKVCTS